MPHWDIVVPLLLFGWSLQIVHPIMDGMSYRYGTVVVSILTSRCFHIAFQRFPKNLGSTLEMMALVGGGGS